MYSPLWGFCLLSLAPGEWKQSECLPMTTPEQVIEEIFAKRRLTRRDQQMIMAMFSKRALSAKEADLINRIYEALSQGRLRVVD